MRVTTSHLSDVGVAPVADVAHDLRMVAGIMKSQQEQVEGRSDIVPVSPVRGGAAGQTRCERRRRDGAATPGNDANVNDDSGDDDRSGDDADGDEDNKSNLLEVPLAVPRHHLFRRIARPEHRVAQLGGPLVDLELAFPADLD